MTAHEDSMKALDAMEARARKPRTPIDLETGQPAPGLPGRPAPAPSAPPTPAEVAGEEFVEEARRRFGWQSGGSVL
jgi:hypothetical protein